MLKLGERNGVMPFRRAGIARAEQWTVQRQEATGDWGGIIPAMLNAMLALRALGYDADDPVVVRGWSRDRRLHDRRRRFVSRAAVHLAGVGHRARGAFARRRRRAAQRQAARSPPSTWLLDKQIVATYGDWSVKNRTGKPGGWAFEFENAWYPDVDDTAVVVMALGAVDHPDAARVRARDRARRAVGRNDAVQDRRLGRVRRRQRSRLAQPHPVRRSQSDDRSEHRRRERARARDGRALQAHRLRSRALRSAASTYLLDEQEIDGAWFGRWGVNYVYGTSGALAALGPARADRAHRPRRRARRGVAAQRAKRRRRLGRNDRQLQRPVAARHGPSTASQTAWALIGLLEAIQRLPRSRAEFTPAIERGVDFLLRTQRPDGNWDEPEFTGTGFPVHFYLNYHQYRLHFPLSALGRYAAWRRTNP